MGLGLLQCQALLYDSLATLEEHANDAIGIHGLDPARLQEAFTVETVVIAGQHVCHGPGYLPSGLTIYFYVPQGFQIDKCPIPNDSSNCDVILLRHNYLIISELT